jgi:transcription elongation factor Elf1
MSHPLSFHCPHCQHKYSDDLDVLDLDEAHEFKCESCSLPFIVRISECQACLVDTAFTWTVAPASAALDQLNCAACGASYRQAVDGETETNDDLADFGTQCNAEETNAPALHGTGDSDL